MTLPSLTDRVRGCLLGGAAGEALGCAVEFKTEAAIHRQYGADGITAYALSPDGLARISDGTLLTMFTAAGILSAEKNTPPLSIRQSVARAYEDWLKTQSAAFPQTGYTELLRIPALYALRAPGTTCLSALEAGRADIENYFTVPCNFSKGCGGVIRTAPLALHALSRTVAGPVDWDYEAAQLAAITHGHPLGYIPSAVLNHLLCHLMSGSGSLRDGLEDAISVCFRLFEGCEYLDELSDILHLAVELSGNSQSDSANIRYIGEGRVAEETLAIALYCALRHEGDFSSALIAAVNHDGDSASTGLVAGSLMGAMVGRENIDKKWKQNLEFTDLLLSTADALCPQSI